MAVKRKVVIAIALEEDPRPDTLDTWRCRDSVEKALISLGFSFETYCIKKKDFKDKSRLAKEIKSLQPLCVFNLFEGFEDDPLKEAQFVAIMERSGITFTGNPSRAFRNCCDKYRKKIMLGGKKIPVPKGIFLKDTKDCDIDGLALPLFIKPRYENASLGADKNSLVGERRDLSTALRLKLAEFPRGVVLEEFIPGKEYVVGFLGTYPYELLAVSVIDYSRHKDCLPFFSYDAKWNCDSSEFRNLQFSVEESLNSKLCKRIVELSRNAGGVLNCQSYFRVDLREDKEEVFILDVNPNPDLNSDAGFMKQAAYQGFSYAQVIAQIIDFACLPPKKQVRGLRTEPLWRN